jgi:hypothetical protein
MTEITHQQNAPYFHFLSFNPYTCFNPYKAIFRGLVMYIYFTYIVYVCYYVIYVDLGGLVVSVLAT